MTRFTRRSVVGGAASIAALHATGAFAQGTPAGGPVTLNIVDVAGNLQLTQEAIERFRSDNPKLVSRMNFSRAPSPELPAKLKAMQRPNRVDIDLVLTGPGRHVGRHRAGPVDRLVQVAGQRAAEAEKRSTTSRP